MGLHDRLSKQNGNGAGNTTAERPAGHTGPVARTTGQQASAGGDPGATDPYAELKTRIHHAVIAKLGPELFKRESAEDLSERVLHAVTEQLALDRTPLTREERRRIQAEISDDVLGYGPLEPFLRDDTVSEVMVNAHDRIFVEREGRLERTDASFVDDAHVMRIIDKIVSQVGRRIDESSPMVDARLPDGSRVNAIIPPVAVDGSLLTIRKFAAEPLTVDDLVAFGSLPRTVADLLRACVAARLNIIVSGGTGAGKTTTLNVLSAFIPEDERIVTIEDAAELRLVQDHVVRLESRAANIEGKGAVTIMDLVKNSLRMRPERIIVGEIRGGEALSMLQAMNTGHDGSLSTGHANAPRDMLSRIETMCLMAGVDLPQRAIREQISSAIDLIVQISRLKDGSRKITHITEVQGMEGEAIVLQDVFVFEQTAYVDGKVQGRLRPTGIRPKFSEKFEAAGIRLPQGVFGDFSGLPGR